MMHEDMRIAIGNPHVRRSQETMLLEAILIGLDGVLMLDDAGVKSAKGVIEEELRTIFEKMEQQRKRISYLEKLNPPKKPTGRPRKENK